MNNQGAYTKAKKRIEAKMGFYIHLTIYLGIGILLTIINLTVTKGYFWAIWPMIGWGSGVMVHGLFTFVFTKQSGIMEKMIIKEMQKGGAQ